MKNRLDTCQHCGRGLGPMRRLSGDSFCSDEHREAYTTFMQAVMLDRLRQSAQRIQNAYTAKGPSAEWALPCSRAFRSGWVSRMPNGHHGDDDQSLVLRAV